MRRRQRYLLVVIGLLAAVVGVGAYRLDALDRLELTALDARFSLRGKQEPARDIRIVDIDASTLTELDERFPFRRRHHARAIQAIARDRPTALAYDIEFVNRTNDFDDGELIDAIDRARPVVLAATQVDQDGRTNVLGGGTLIDEIGAQPGNVNFGLDPGTVFRRVPYEIEGLRHFAVVAAEVATEEAVTREDVGGDSAFIDYAGPPGTYPSVSLADVLFRRLPDGFFRDKVVVVGSSLPALQDRHPTSSTGSELMTGTEILANAIDTIRRGAPLREVAAAVDILAIVVLALLSPLFALVMSPLRAIGLTLAGGALFAVANQFAFNGGHILAITYPTGALLFAAAGGLAIHYMGAVVERERTRDLFARFVPEKVVDEVLACAEDGVRLGGVRRHSSVLFSDLRGFTSWAEHRRPDEVITVLNRYLGEMSDAILDCGGTLVAYMGDGIMAVFGAPLTQPDHADRALAAAREMLEVRLPRFNASLARDDLGGGFRMGVGINSGPVMSGNVGSARRVEYAAVGDTTNTAARLEAMTKGTPHQLLIADATRAALRKRPLDLVAVEDLEIRGREGRVRAWTLDGS